MLPVFSKLQFFLYREPTDMRRGFDGLSGLVSSYLKQDALSGDVFVFINRRRNRIKLLVWDGDGVNKNAALTVLRHGRLQTFVEPLPCIRLGKWPNPPIQTSSSASNYPMTNC